MNATDNAKSNALNLHSDTLIVPDVPKAGEFVMVICGACDAASVLGCSEVGDKVVRFPCPWPGKDNCGNVKP